MINLYVANEVGQKAFDASKIIKNVWESDGWLTFTAPEVGEMCLSVPNSVNKLCLDAGSSCKTGDNKCAEAFKRYAEALKQGYKKDFATFTKESKALGYLNTAVGIVGGFFGSATDSPEGPAVPGSEVDVKNKKKSKNIAIGIGVGVLVIGAIITVVVLRRNKKG